MSFFIVSLLTVFAAMKAEAKGTIEVIAVRHAESLNNILSNKKSPIQFFIAAFKERGSLGVTNSLFHNPVLSPEGKKQAQLLRDTLFPNRSDPFKILLKDPEHNTKFFVSPLNRTIQTAVIVFGERLYQSGVDMLANPLITEHRKSISEDGYEDADRPIALFDLEWDELTKEKMSPEIDRKAQQFQIWETTFKDSLRACCNGKSWWPQGPVETEDQIQARIALFKKSLMDLPDNTRVILVSHGTFLRSLFFGVRQMRNKDIKIRNTGMLIGQFDKETGEFVDGSVSCFDPKLGKSATGLDPQAICFSKTERPESIVVDKGPVHEIGKAPPFGSWQTRQLNIFNNDGVIGVTWNDKGNMDTTKVKGAALLLGTTTNCDIPALAQDIEKVCLIIERVKIDKKTGPVWDASETGKWEVLRLTWPKSNTEATKALRLENLLQE